MPNLRWTFAIVAGLLVLAAGEGPDFGSYTDWAAAALTGDVFALRGNVLSPGGVPFTLAAAGPGLLFAIGKAALLPLTLVSAAIVTGWVAAIVFWACALVVLRRVTDGDDRLAVFGAGALFIGTHAGPYSHLYATEVFANALIAALWAIALTRDRWRVADGIAVGALAGLLLLVRAHVVLYAVPALWMAVFAGSDGAGWRPALRRAIAAGVPLGIAALEYATINRWMTGAWLHPPYLYGGAGFSSVDLAHPELAAVLTHPLHGLLAYHPLYGIAFAAVVLQIGRTGPRRAWWAMTGLAVVLHIWVQAGWYIWWLGGTTFGMRGMAPAALPLVAGLVAAIHRDAQAHSRRTVVWLGLALLACTWSFPLLLRGNSQFYSWSALLTSQWAGLIAVGTVAVAFGLTVAWRRTSAEPDTDRLVQWWSVALVAAVVAYLGYQAVQLSGVVASRAAGALAAAAVAGGLTASARWHHRSQAVALAAVLGLFAAQATLFARLVWRTDQALASGAAPPRSFAYLSASPVDELRVTYAEYLEIPGFDSRKESFRRFLQWQRIDASRLSPLDRQLANQLLDRFDRDPSFERVLIEPIVRDSIAQLYAANLTDSQQSRARELTLAIHGIRGVTFR